jgi:DNA-binding HxlR family transcriptional regulator
MERDGNANTSANSVKGEVLAEDCPSRAILQHVTSRNGALTLVALARGMSRFEDLSQAVGANERMFMQTLQRLEADGLVVHVPDSMPHDADYRLTPLGIDLAAKVEALAGWIEQNLQTLLAAQLEYSRQRKRGAAAGRDEDVEPADEQDLA